MAMIGALKKAVLNHVKIQVSPNALAVTGSKSFDFQTLIVRHFSGHGDAHLTKDEVTERILAVVKDYPKIDPSKVTPEVHFQRDLGLDSLDNVELVMAIEEEFKLEIPDLEADRIDSCKNAIEYVYNHPLSS
ncbi:acyl carrier protein 1, mitochondrial [Silene latifolia]|uniref:acyl carrier protein 1, mitochondrial n=1 Tax=Silene latifolia TaxID=37657 RepID=UPI003D7843A8